MTEAFNRRTLVLVLNTVEPQTFHMLLKAPLADAMRIGSSALKSSTGVVVAPRYLNLEVFVTGHPPITSGTFPSGQASFTRYSV
jgi:hypothetical protein